MATHTPGTSTPTGTTPETRFTPTELSALAQLGLALLDGFNRGTVTVKTDGMADALYAFQDALLSAADDAPLAAAVATVQQEGSAS